MIPRSRSTGGFTLVEVIVASTLAAVVMAAVLSCFIFLGRSLTRLANYQTLEAKSRQALAYFRSDFALAREVKAGTSPTASTVTLVLPAGEVTYSYDASIQRLRRQANFGPNPDFYLLQNDRCLCPAFGFSYYTTTGGDPVDKPKPYNTMNVPYSIKQIEVRFILKTPGVFSPATRATYETISSRFLIRNKQLPTGS